MKYTILDTNNLPTAFYDDAIHATIPSGAIQITDAQWQEFINNQGNRAWDASTSSVIHYTPPFDLAAAQKIKRNEIRAAFNATSKLPVLDPNGILWDGGYDSAIKLDSAKRLAQVAGQTTVDFYDSSNVPHTLTFSEADAVILLVGVDYQTKFAKKQSLLAQIDALPPTATQADLDAIIISF